MKTKSLAFIGFPNYSVTTDGRVLSFHGSHPRVLRPRIDKDGYQVVSLYHRGRSKVTYVHTLVLIAFVGPRPLGMICRHFPDRNPLNCNLDNLQWGTMTQNASDRVVHETERSKGENNPNVKLTNGDIANIRKLKGVMSCSKIAKEFKVHKSTISAILRGEKWK